ncbi:hypothetical protein FQN57_006479 [Myotisia sp. PD_48]|nr:hypothetical protein FQN57_006479 [Myotisia sp. PD_48]
MPHQNNSTSRIINSLPGSLPTAPIDEDTDPVTVASAYVSNLSQLSAADLTENALWRDQFALTGNSRTFHTPDQILTAWNDTGAVHKPSDFKPIPNSERVVRLGSESAWVEARYSFKTNGSPITYCSGFISLTPDGKGGWRIWLLRTMLERLDGQPDVDTLETKEQRVASGQNGHDKRDASETDFECIVVGAGQGGLGAAGRLQSQGISTLLIERNPKVGDNWMFRYESAKLHTVRNYAHLPFERTFGPEYPEFLTKFVLADAYQEWVKRYDITGTWDDEKKHWTIRVIKEGKEEVVLKTKHLVLAVGTCGQIPTMPQLQGREKFKGTILHSVNYTTAYRWSGQEGVVVGAANTAHDVAEDMLAAKLSSVTMVQRGETYVLPIEHYHKYTSGLFNDTMPTELADRHLFTNPLAIGRLATGHHLHAMARADSERYESLERAGFLTERYGDILYHINERGGGHYMDVGASKKIAQGLIKIKSNANLVGYAEDGLLFDDGSKLKANVVIFTTGFVGTIRDSIAVMLGQNIADQVEEFWGLDEEGELHGAFKPTGHPALWYSGGTLGHTRFLSRFIALQIKAALLGTPLQIYGGTPAKTVKNSNGHPPTS